MSVTEQHTVTLPHPSRTGEKTVGGCHACGWRVRYGWGGQGQAGQAAEDHVREAGRAHPVVIQRIDGDITVMEGLSL